MSKYAVFREQNELWTKQEIAKMSDQQKACLINLVKHMNPEIFDMKKEDTRKTWIRIMAGIYLRMIRNYGPEDYHAENWRQKREKMKGFDITPLYEKNNAQAPLDQRGVVRSEVLNT